MFLTNKKIMNYSNGQRTMPNQTVSLTYPDRYYHTVSETPWAVKSEQKVSKSSNSKCLGIFIATIMVLCILTAVGLHVLCNFVGFVCINLRQKCVSLIICEIILIIALSIHKKFKKIAIVLCMLGIFYANAILLQHFLNIKCNALDQIQSLFDSWYVGICDAMKNIYYAIQNIKIFKN